MNVWSKDVTCINAAISQHRTNTCKSAKEKVFWLKMKLNLQYPFDLVQGTNMELKCFHIPGCRFSHDSSQQLRKTVNQKSIWKTCCALPAVAYYSSTASPFPQTTHLARLSAQPAGIKHKNLKRLDIFQNIAQQRHVQSLRNLFLPT